MANFASDPRSDYIVNSATLRNLPPEFVANAHLDYALNNDRLKTFLSRNLISASASHRQRVREAQTARSKQTQTEFAEIREPMNGDAIASNNIIQVNGFSTPVTTLDDASSEQNTSVSVPAVTSTKMAFRKRKTDWYDSKRQSLRNQNKNQHEDPDSFLVFKVNNIRKKLNWKDSKTAREIPPRKKPRHESVDCDISLAIWDNSGQTKSRLPLVIKREFCQCTKIRRGTDQVIGEFVELKLDEPFVISQREIRVAVNTGKDRMGLAKEYFMEIKISPRDDKVVWPPIPMLGKSDGDRFNGMGTDAKDETKTSMIARYQHLPTAPEADTPLSIFVYAEGRTFRTKYGLEVSAQWVPKDHPSLIRRPLPEPSVEPWALDSDLYPFGSRDPDKKVVKPVSRAARKTITSNRKLVARVPKLPKITYNIRVAGGAKMGFNKCSVRGLKCYSCSGKSFETLVELRFHLDQHHKNTITVENEVIDQTDSRLISATIMIETHGNQRLRAIRSNNDDDDNVDKIFTYEAPDIPFDLDSHYTNKKTPWTDILPAQLSQEAARAPLPIARAKDSQSIVRLQHKGHIPYRKVLPFRPQEYPRKKFPSKKLLTKHASLENPYTSISHNPVDLDDDDDARSETDDEIDDHWFVDRHMEELDIQSRQESWSEPRRRLAKKWDWHILHRERGISAKYMGDCLIRFVRMEKRWILREDMKDDPVAHSEAQMQSIAVFMEMMDELKTMKVINENVCTDVMIMLYNDDVLEIPIEERKEVEAESEEVSKRSERIRRYKNSTKPRESLGPPSTKCAKCRSAIGYDGQRAVRCCSPGCSTPNVWYHARCVGLSMVGDVRSQTIESAQAVIVHQFMKKRSTWKCDKCTNTKGKSNVRLISPILASNQAELVNVQAAADFNEVDEEMSEVAVEDPVMQYRSSPAEPSAWLAQNIMPKDVNEILEETDLVYTAWIDDRRSLRGIVAHHFHINYIDGSKCIYAIIDERPSRSRSKKPHTVLAISQEHAILASTRQNLVTFPDDVVKRDSERWKLNDRDVETEIFTRFRPYKVQHYVSAVQCTSKSNIRDSVVSGSQSNKPDSYYYGRNGRLDKEPGRGFYYTEQNNPGAVWAGDYFEEMQRSSKRDSAFVCKEASHYHCAHSVTAERSKYKQIAKVDFVPWSALHILNHVGNSCLASSTDKSTVLTDSVQG